MAAKNAKFAAHSDLTNQSSEQLKQLPQRKLIAQAVSTALLAGVASGPLLAQDIAIEEVIVTATKRAESIMDVPLAITAMTGSEIRDVNLNDIKDLIAFTPGITGNSKDSFLDFVSVRGIRTIDYGNGGDPSVSLYKNGLYQGRTGSAVSSLYDIERSEVLRGPQGFLFGRNSVSGAMNIITAKPNFDGTSGYVDFDAGQRGAMVFEGAVNMPASENIAFRLSGYHSEEDGYVKNLAGGPDLIAHDKSAVRLSGRYQTDTITADLFVEYEDRDQTGTVYRATGLGDAHNIQQTRINGGVPIEVSPDGRTVNNDNSLTPEDLAEIFHVGLQFDIDLGSVTLTSLTGYKDHDYSYVEDYDASPLILFNYGQDQEGDYFEQELRLTSNNDGPLSWYAGASYYKENIDTVFLGQADEDTYCLGYWYYSCQNLFDYYVYWDYTGGTTTYSDTLNYYWGTTTWTPSADGFVNDRNRIIGKYTGYSVYADLSYDFSETFDVSVGLRYSYDEKEFSQEVLPDPGNSLLVAMVQSGFTTPNGPLRDKQDWDEVTYRVVANWRPTDQGLVFGSITTGYKPGGFGSFNIEGTGCDPFVWGACAADPATSRPGDFGPETVTSYELGYKGTILNNRMQFTANVFYYDYEDLQAIYTEGLRSIVDNVGQVDGSGFEADLNARLSDNVGLRFGFSYFDSEAVDVQAFCDAGLELTGDPDACEGNSIPWAPQWTAFAILNGSIPAGDGEVFGRIAWSWEDDYRGDWPDKDVIYQRIQALNKTDVIAGYRTDNWSISAYVENVYDHVWYDGNYGDDPSSIGIYSQHAFGPSRPRTAGVRFGYDF